MARVEDAPSVEGDAEERRLIDRSAAGDQEAFRQLVLRHHRLVINVAFRALGELALAEDVAQDVFIKVYKALPGYRHDKPFKHWLHRVAANALTPPPRAGLPPRRRGPPPRRRRPRSAGRRGPPRPATRRASRDCEPAVTLSR